MTERTEFPCWLVADDKGALAFDWEEIRLVEYGDDGAASVFLEDGSEWIFLAAQPVGGTFEFFSKLAKVLALRALAIVARAKPPC